MNFWDLSRTRISLIGPRSKLNTKRLKLEILRRMWFIFSIKPCLRLNLVSYISKRRRLVSDTSHLQKFEKKNTDWEVFDYVFYPTFFILDIPFSCLLLGFSGPCGRTPVKLSIIDQVVTRLTCAGFMSVSGRARYFWRGWIIFIFGC